MKLGNLLNYQTPTGQKGNVLNPADWLSLLLGVFVFFAVLGTGQKIAKKADGKLGLDTTPSNFFETPAVVVAGRVKL